MILSVTLSKPVSNIQDYLDKPYEKIKIKVENSSNGLSYYGEMFTKTQVFHKHFSETELEAFLNEHAGKTFKNCVKRTETEEITILSNKKGKITTLTKKISDNSSDSKKTANIFDKGDRSLCDKNNDKGDRSLYQKKLNILPAPQHKKNYLLPEGRPVPFLVLLGVMNSEGKVIASKYDKFRQINRYLEFINDILPELIKDKGDRAIRIIDFGCGKSYLTFAVHYFLTEIKNIPCTIEGLDLKKDVIDYCNQLTKKLNLKNLIFHTGNISDYNREEAPDLIITLHACDTATDYALKYAVEKGARAILSVPCCQHQINTQLQPNVTPDNEISTALNPLLKWGIIREKFSSLVTDALRGQWLENQGYKVQMLEFIDMEHTPKNILIRAVKNNKAKTNNAPSIVSALNINPEIWK